MRFVEGCDFEEFGRYLARIGQYATEGEPAKLRAFIDNKFFNLIVFREKMKSSVTQSGMSQTPKSIGKGILETKRIQRYCRGSLGERRISLNFTNSG